jgi:hypothetical protein
MNEIELTDVQRQALQARQGKAVDLVDPTTQQRYVLLAQEHYERVRTLMEQDMPPAVSSPVSTTQEEQPARVRLRDLPTPPEVLDEVERCCKKYAWNRQEVEEQLKLQYYYGGQAVYRVRSSEGSIIIPIPERYRDTPDLRYVLLTPQERSCACLEIPTPWRETTSEILT